MEMDKFNGVTNAEFIDYFKIDLHSRMEIINYTYPHELLDEDAGFGEHVHRCTALLKDYILLCFRNAKAAGQQKDALESTGTDAQQTDSSHTETGQENPAQRSERLEIERKQENEQSALKYLELRDEIGRLIDEHRENVKIIYVDL
jgi:hypothetical protein